MLNLGLSIPPDEVLEDEGNLLTTVGANDLFSGLSASLGVPYIVANAQLAVGDSSTAATTGQTDLQAAVGTQLNAADPASASNTTPIVVTATLSPAPTAGQVLVFAGFTGAGATAINNTFEVNPASGASVTLLNSVGTGTITVPGATVSPVNYFRQVLSSPPVVSGNTMVVSAIFIGIHANFAWHCFGLTTGAQNANQQSQPPPHMFDRVVSSLGTKVSPNVWQLTVTLSLA